VTQNTTEVSASQQNVTHSKRRKVNVPPNPTALIDTWPDGPPPGVAFGVRAPLSYRSVLSPHSLPHTGRSCVTLDEVTLSHPHWQGQGVADAISTPLQAPPTPAPPVSIPTHLVTVGSVSDASASRFNLDGAIPRQRLSSACSSLPPSPSCWQASPEPLACPLVAPNELTQVTDLLASFAGVVSTTPVVVSMWPTLLTTLSSEQSVVVPPRF